jgi:hypothetical protein
MCFSRQLHGEAALSGLRALCDQIKGETILCHGLFFASALALSVLCSSAVIAQTSGGTGTSGSGSGSMGTMNNNGNTGTNGTLNGNDNNGSGTAGTASSGMSGSGMGNGGSTSGTAPAPPALVRFPAQWAVPIQASRKHWKHQFRAPNPLCH